MLFKNFEMKDTVDRVLVYITLYSVGRWHSAPYTDVGIYISGFEGSTQFLTQNYFRSKNIKLFNHVLTADNGAACLFVRLSRKKI